MKTWRRSICLGSLLLVPLAALANNQHFALAATGRFDELARLIETEGKFIEQNIPASAIFARAQASEEIFKSRAPAFRMRHVASHGEFNGADALPSRLLLAKSGTEDGSLTVGDLYNMRLDANLVILSAGETGLGTVQTGDEVLGLTRLPVYRQQQHRRQSVESR